MAKYSRNCIWNMRLGAHRTMNTTHQRACSPEIPEISAPRVRDATTQLALPPCPACPCPNLPLPPLSTDPDCCTDGSFLARFKVCIAAELVGSLAGHQAASHLMGRPAVRRHADEAYLTVDAEFVGLHAFRSMIRDVQQA